jgi:hypothetical protein
MPTKGKGERGQQETVAMRPLSKSITDLDKTKKKGGFSLVLCRNVSMAPPVQ